MGHRSGPLCSVQGHVRMMADLKRLLTTIGSTGITTTCIFMDISKLSRTTYNDLDIKFDICEIFQ